MSHESGEERIPELRVSEVEWLRQDVYARGGEVQVRFESECSAILREFLQKIQENVSCDPAGAEDLLMQSEAWRVMNGVDTNVLIPEVLLTEVENGLLNELHDRLATFVRNFRRTLGQSNQ